MASGSKRLVECVPNFSEGKRKEVIDAISTAIRDTEGCTLLLVEPEASANRTVYTFVGDPVSIVEGAVNAAKVAHSLIDMRKHKGNHPRMGALDVCPFIPVSDVTMEDCINCSNEFGSRLSKELNVPLYLYEYSCTGGDHRRTLPQIRAGEYEGLKDKIIKSEWTPDYGPAQFVPSWGATVTGARPMLIAYNVNLLGTKQQAHRIALDIREQGRGPDNPGKFKCVRAIGWDLEDKGLSQISINLTDYKTTPIHAAYEECVRIAKDLKLAVVGSEIVGLVPLEAVMLSADYYIQKESLFIYKEEQKIRLVIERLGLSSLSYFNPKEKIIEYCIGSTADGPLVSSSVRDFIESIGSRASTPGGGSASACIASIGSALATMVGLMSYGKREFEGIDGIMRETILPLYDAMEQLIPIIDSDSTAFSSYMDALKMPHSNDEESTKRSLAMQEGLKRAIEVPLGLMRKAHSCWPHLFVLAEHGNKQTMSDLQVSASSLHCGVFGGYCNVLINLKGVTDTQYVTEIRQEVEQILAESQDNSDKVQKLVLKRL
ncbi:PREDICTED: formimidoyltransferase-cyclodeaminase-like [Amphimedon queenslandica]|uniref:Formimidoyltransferase-cyclodeaminase n=1 Tax=Amphimedon queenslandica TaxID=400682 RepID=A0A1X7UM09_AMPQE|nr:PREDICTED: formimidoyltransferase-cyclodeaminase-like [Amphimedon queenslandica]|eukprot:XP_003387546.1 PREDICTED: formimidoyltransferase-cyclodeaminase-like [Amphimedon queenslandica]